MDFLTMLYVVSALITIGTAAYGVTRWIGRRASGSTNSAVLPLASPPSIIVTQPGKSRNGRAIPIIMIGLLVFIPGAFWLVLGWGGGIPIVILGAVVMLWGYLRFRYP